MTHLDETSPELVTALRAMTTRVFGQELLVDVEHTGGGMMVCRVDLSIDGRFLGRQVWLTREGDAWLLGFYDLYADATDEGVFVYLTGRTDDADTVANQVGGILSRLGTTLQGA